MNTLHSAALSGDLILVRQLLAEGAEIDCRNESDGATPLIAACLSPAAGPDVMETLLDHGADIHACVERSYGGEEPLIALAVTSSQVSCEKIRLLIRRGADINYRSSHGYTLMTWAACLENREVIDLLLSLGAPLDGESIHRESSLSVLSRQGDFEAITKLLAHGADPSPLEWTPLHRAIALGSLEDVRTAIAAGADLEMVDFWERTAFLLSIQVGDIKKTSLLLASGANRHAVGRCGKPPMFYPINHDDSRMMRWLVEKGFDPNQKNEFGESPLREAAEEGAVACFQVLLDSGADPREKDKGGDSIIRHASHPEIIGKLINLGENLSHLERPALRNWIGLGTCDELSVGKEEFLKNRTHRFATSNPEKMDVPFWQSMVRNGWEAYEATRYFEESFDRENPVWCHHRLGMSLTALPDGRFIQIAGEHEDGYDPDFCIYNDVIIHDGKGGFEILGYPEEAFPPTDFHSATLVGEWIYIIGNLGYPKTREAHGYETPVYRFHITSGKIEHVVTAGQSPGWIHSHDAKQVEGGIHISGGKKYHPEEDSSGRLTGHTGSHVLDLESGSWQNLES